MSSDRRVRQTLFNAIKVIVETQNEQGGWRYQPRKDEADVSVTVCQLMALRAARNAGVFVPDETVSRAVDYLHQSQNVDGGFMYMNEEREKPLFQEAAAAIVALYNAGESGTSEIERGLDYLDNFLPRKIEGLLPSHFFLRPLLCRSGDVACWRKTMGSMVPCNSRRFVALAERVGCLERFA